MRLHVNAVLKVRIGDHSLGVRPEHVRKSAAGKTASLGGLAATRHYGTIGCMCGRFEISALDQILATFDAEDTVELGPPRYNIAPSQQIPIVRQDDGRRTITLARWGLVPYWADDISIGNR
jgi:hypothetical protein